MDGSSPLCERLDDPFHWLPGWRWVRETELWSHRDGTDRWGFGWFTDRFHEATDTMLNILVSTAFWLSGVVWQITLALMELALNPHDYADAFFRNLGESMARQLSHAIGLGPGTQIALYMVVLIVGWIAAALTLMRQGGAAALKRLMQTMIPLALLVVMYNAMEANNKVEDRYAAGPQTTYGEWDASWGDLNESQQAKRRGDYSAVRVVAPEAWPELGPTDQIVGTRWSRVYSEARRIGSGGRAWTLSPAVMSPRWLFEESSRLSQLVSQPLVIAADRISAVRHEDAPVTNCDAYNRSLESIFLASYAAKAPPGTDDGTIYRRAMVPILVSRMWYQTYGFTYGAAQFGSYSGALKAMCFNGESQAGHVPGIEVLGVWDHTCRTDDYDDYDTRLWDCNPSRSYTVLDADIATGRFKPHRGSFNQVRSHMVVSLACQYIDPANVQGRTLYEPVPQPARLHHGVGRQDLWELPWVHGDPISVASGSVWIDRPWVTVGKAGDEEPPISLDTCIRWADGFRHEGIPDIGGSIPVVPGEPVEQCYDLPTGRGRQKRIKEIKEGLIPGWWLTPDESQQCTMRAPDELHPLLGMDWAAYSIVDVPGGPDKSTPNFYERQPHYYWDNNFDPSPHSGQASRNNPDLTPEEEAYLTYLSEYAEGTIIRQSADVTLEDIGVWRNDLANLAISHVVMRGSDDVKSALPTSEMAADTAAAVRRMHGRDWAWRMFQGVLALISAVAYFMTLIGLAVGLVLSQLILAGVFIVMPVLLMVMALPVRAADELPKKLLKLILGAMLAHAIFALVLSFVIVVGAVLGTAIGDVVPSMSGADQWARVILLSAVPLIALKLVGIATKQFGLNVGSFKGAIQATSGMALAQMGNDGGRSPGQYARQQMMRGRRMMYGANRWSRVADHFGGGATAGFAAGAGAGIAGAHTTRNMPNMTSGPRPDGRGGPSGGMPSDGGPTGGRPSSGAPGGRPTGGGQPGGGDDLDYYDREFGDGGSGPDGGGSSPQGGGMPPPPPPGDAPLPDFGPDRSARGAVWDGMQRAGRGAAFVRRHKKKIIAGAAVVGALPLSISAGAVIPALVGAKIASKVAARPMRAAGAMRAPVQQRAETIRARRRGVETAGRLMGMGPGPDAAASSRVTSDTVRRNEDLIDGRPNAGGSDEQLSDIYEHMERSLGPEATETRRWAYVQSACRNQGIDPRAAWRVMFGQEPPNPR